MDQRGGTWHRKLICGVMFPLGLAGSLFPGLPAVANTVDGYSLYTAWLDWARVRPAARSDLASSYDRNGGNNDWNQYDWPPGFRTDHVTATVRSWTGPGIVHRFWMPHRCANDAYVVRMYFDNEPTPRINTTSDVLLSGGFAWMTAPLVNTFAGGQCSYEPIPFQHALRIETVNQGTKQNYYQYNCTLFPEGTQVGTYTGELTPAMQAARAAVAAMFGNPGQHPAGPSTTSRSVSVPSAVLAPGSRLELARLAGPGVVRGLYLDLREASDTALSDIRLHVSYDRQLVPAIEDIPVGDFFGAGRSRAPYRSLAMGTDSPEGFYCHFPMPFRQSIRIELRNAGAQAVNIGPARVEYECQRLDPDMAYLHARYHSTLRESGQLYHKLFGASGIGHYVGNLLYVEHARDHFQLLEGDELITVDGVRTLYGTGLEDAYNGGYYYNWSNTIPTEPEGSNPQSAIRALHGILYVRRDGTPIARADQYRWQIADRVYFARSIDVRIENQYALVGGRFTSVAFWYQLPRVSADIDLDGDVDGTDLSVLLSCVSGPAIPRPGGSLCAQADLDEDGDVDQNDFGLLQRCFRGAGVPADLDCTP